jgi:hypothetical protein
MFLNFVFLSSNPFVKTPYVWVFFPEEKQMLLSYPICVS